MIYNRKDIYQGKSFENFGEYSEEESLLYKKFIKEGNTVYDIGANIGSFTLLFSRLVGNNGGFVLALEPERHNFYTLCGNVSINNLANVHCFQYAMGEKNGAINIPELNHEEIQNHGGISLNQNAKIETGYTVTLSTIDLIKLPKACSFMKIDVEGMELDVLKGGKNTILKDRPYFYVENDREENSENLIKYIKDELGYKVYEHKPAFFNANNFYGCKEDVFVRDMGKTFISLNLFCVPNELRIEENDIKELKLKLI
jgi:FkbM family methyltransferase